MKSYFSARGDQGQTDQLGKNRVSKAHLRIQTVGALDEAQAALGVARAEAESEPIQEIIKTIQLDLYQIMTLVSLEEPHPDKFPDLESGRIDWLEGQIASYGAGLEKPEGFIVPGENRISAAFGMARTIVRRAERQAVALHDQNLLYSETTLPYLNRLSSLLFVLELLAAQRPTQDPGSRS